MKAFNMIFIFFSLFIIETFSIETPATQLVGAKGKCPDIEFVKDFDVKRVSLKLNKNYS